jgi:hypothetical protein
MTSQGFSSFELPIFYELPPVGGGLSRMSESDYYQESTPRPGASVACFGPPPLKIRRCSMMFPLRKDSITYHFATIPDFGISLKTLHCLVKTEKDISEEDFRLLKSAFEKNFIKMIVGPRKTKDSVVPHHVIIHPASFRKFREVLNSTSDRTYASTNSLMKQVSEDIRQFLTAPEKLENRQRVLQQIRDDRQRVLQQSRDDMS